MGETFGRMAPAWQPADYARQWHALAKRRRDYFVELYRSGRWRLYYTEERFLAHVREVMQEVESWGVLASKDDDRRTADYEFSRAAE
jgi:uncharacterized repeat protein (TIGR03809 family)